MKGCRRLSILLSCTKRTSLGTVVVDGAVLIDAKASI
jgi:hypothetical protein